MATPRYMQCGCVTDAGVPPSQDLDTIVAVQVDSFALVHRFYAAELAHRAEPQLCDYYRSIGLDELGARPPEQDLAFYCTASWDSQYDVPHRLQVKTLSKPC